MHQGYDGMAHGGILSAIIDASMAQCLMGHGVVGYTTDLSIKYRKPVLIDKPVALTTSITDIGIGCLYCLKSEIIQGRNLVAQATGRFYKINQPS
jgi:acyl-coenzyme A thioesterase PaaI-like protein